MTFGCLKGLLGPARVFARRSRFVVLGGSLLLCVAALSPGGQTDFPARAPVPFLPVALPTVSPAVAAPHPVTVARVTARGDQRSARTAITLEVVNGGAAFAGWLEVSGADRRVLVAVDVPAGSARLSTAAYPVDNRGTARLRLLDAAEAPVSAWKQFTVDFATRALVVGDDRYEFADFLSRSGWLAVDQESSLPSGPWALDPYAFIVVTGTDGSFIRPVDSDVESEAAAVGALRDWVGRGGVLVAAAPALLPGAVTDGVLEARFGRRLTLDAPAAVTVSDTVDRWDPGLPPLPAGTVVYPVESEEAAGTVVTAEGTVLVARGALGRGLIELVGVTLPPDLDSADDAAVRSLWESLVLSAPRDWGYGFDSRAAPPHVFVTGRVPPLWATGTGSLLYAAVVGLGLFVGLKRAGRRDAVWWVTPIVVAVTTIAVLGVGLAVRGSGLEVMTRRSVSLGDGATVEGLDVGVYAPFGSRFGLTPPDGYVPGALGFDDTAFSRPYTLRDASLRGGTVTYEDVRVYPGAGRSLVLSARGPSALVRGPAQSPGQGPLQWSSVEDGQGRTYTVSNAGSDVLRRLILVVDGVYTLPDLAPGGSATFRVGPRGATGDGLTPVEDEPPDARSRDYVEWEAEGRLLAEWAQYGQWSGFGDAHAVPGPPGKVGAGAVGIESESAPPFAFDLPVRLLAFAEDRGDPPTLDGLRSGTPVRGVVVYEAVLR